MIRFSNFRPRGLNIRSLTRSNSLKPSETSSGNQKTSSNTSRTTRNRNHLNIEKPAASALNATTIGFSLAVIGIAGIVYHIYEYPDGALGKIYQSSPLAKFYDSAVKRFVSGVFEPSSDKLLPDFGDPSVYGQLPPGSVAPPLLVIDVEKTLVGSMYDATAGWRHAKRPGALKLIESLVQYYEIVLFAESDLTTPEIIDALDPQHACHRLFGHHGEMRNNKILKRLDNMNRDIRKIVLLDDSEISSQLFPRNTLLVKPFTDLSDTKDTVLLDLIPLLQAFVHEDCSDFRDVLDKLGTHSAEEAVVEYQMRLSRKKADDFRRKNIGLGRLIRQHSGTEELSEHTIRQSIIPSMQDIVGSPLDRDDTRPLSSDNQSSPLVPKIGFQPVPGAQKKKGAMFEWLDNSEKAREEHEAWKRSQMNALYVKRLEDKNKDKVKLQEES